MTPGVVRLSVYCMDFSFCFSVAEKERNPNGSALYAGEGRGTRLSHSVALCPQLQQICSGSVLNMFCWCF